MAIMPHCVVCGFHSGAHVAGDVVFVDYNPSWQEAEMIGWSNSLGVTAPEGVGLFCRKHLRRAGKLRHLPSVRAVELMRTNSDLRRGPLGWLHNVFG